MWYQVRTSSSTLNFCSLCFLTKNRSLKRETSIDAETCGFTGERIFRFKGTLWTVTRKRHKLLWLCCRQPAERWSSVSCQIRKPARELRRGFKHLKTINKTAVFFFFFIYSNVFKLFAPDLFKDRQVRDPGISSSSAAPVIHAVFTEKYTFFSLSLNQDHWLNSHLCNVSKTCQQNIDIYI